jgi:hypothetical protein
MHDGHGAYRPWIDVGYGHELSVTSDYRDLLREVE